MILRRFQNTAKHVPYEALGTGQKQREEWRRQHAPNYEKNYELTKDHLKGRRRRLRYVWGEGREGGSLQKNNMCYTKTLSNGDSVVYKAVVDANFYPVEKLECVSHCDKRNGNSTEK